MPGPYAPARERRSKECVDAGAAAGDAAEEVRGAGNVKRRKERGERRCGRQPGKDFMPEGKQAWVFNIDDDRQGIGRELAEGITTRIFCGEQAMLSVVRIEPHTRGKVHSHREEQWGLLLEGECVRIQGDEEVAMRAGDFWHTPSGVSHGIRTGDVGATVLDVFSPPREEYRKPGRGF